MVYKIDNLPSCTDIEDERTIRRIIDEAAAAWSAVEGANVLYVLILAAQCSMLMLSLYFLVSSNLKHHSKIWRMGLHIKHIYANKDLG